LGGWYHASKFALEGYSDALRMEGRPFGIHVIVIEPGGTDTEWAPIALAEVQRYSKDGAYAQLMEAMLNSSTMQRKMSIAWHSLRSVRVLQGHQSLQVVLRE
jgi:short-subunit dehydrogenase